MSLLTFGQVQTSRVLEVADALGTSNEFASLVNAATSQLMERGNFWGTVQPMEGCVYDGCVVWPRQVAAVLALNGNCGRYTTPANRWYQFMDWRGQDWGNLYRDWRNRGRRNVSVSDGSLPVFSPIPCGQPRYIRFYIDNPVDIGQTVVLYGTDVNGQPLFGKRADGTYQDGIVLTLANPYVETPMALLNISRVVKSPTQARIRGCQVDNNGVLYDLAVYEPSEISPDYVRTKIPGPCHSKHFTALVKLAFIPVQYPDDQVQIENVAALRDMVYSIKKKEAGDLQESILLEKSAIRELNYQMRTRFPDEQFLVRFAPFGSDSLSNYRTAIGMI